VPADLESATGKIVETVRHVANVTAALGDGLRAGQFIICGAITGPMFLEPGETGIDFTLEPAGSVSVRFSY
jgi:2-keto-4-pentenoate hydratase